MGENYRVLIYLYNCKFCRFEGVGRFTFLYQCYSRYSKSFPPQPIKTRPLELFSEPFSIKNKNIGTERGWNN